MSYDPERYGFMSEDGRRYYSISDIKRANKAAGFYFFSPGALRFFRSRVHDAVHQGPGGIYFVTSEQFIGIDWFRGPRRYTIRQFDPETGDIDTLGDFQEYASRSGAHKAATRAAQGSGL